MLSVESQALVSSQPEYYASIPAQPQHSHRATPWKSLALGLVGVVLLCHPWISGTTALPQSLAVSTQQKATTSMTPLAPRGFESGNTRQSFQLAEPQQKTNTALQAPVLAGLLSPLAGQATGAEEIPAAPEVATLADVGESNGLQIIGALLIFTAVVVAIQKSQEPTAAYVEGGPEWENPVPHPNWTRKQMEMVTEEHTSPVSAADWLAYGTSKTIRVSFDVLAGFYMPPITERKWLYRLVFLEAVAGVPGMVAGLVRHFQSLRNLERDRGWIHTLLEDAENERMHLITFMGMLNPSPLLKGAVTVTQGVFASGFFMAYLVWPNLCHRFVGYVEEEAVHSYTMLLDQLDKGDLPEFADMPCPEVGRRYWHLSDNASMRDLILAVRADEANHRMVQHTFATMRHDQPNPFTPIRPGCDWVCPMPDEDEETSLPEETVLPSEKEEKVTL